METLLVLDLQLWTIISKEVQVASLSGMSLISYLYTDNQPREEKM